MTRDEAKQLVISQSFVVDDPGATDHGRRLHHCRMSMTGADWDEGAVLELIDRADEVDWEDSFLFGKGLAVYADNRHYFFDTVRPPA